MALCPEHPKRDQNPKFTPLSETTSIPVCFIWESPPRGPEILTNPEREIIASQLKYVASLSIFSACQLCKKRIGDESGESVRCQNCKVRQRIINCRREDSVKLCIQHNESELWLTAFTNEIENLLKNTTASMSSTIDGIEYALMSLKDVKLKYNSQRNIVKEVLNL